MTSTDQKDRLFEFQAAICRTFANPWRLRIVETLGDGELTVSQLVEALGVPKSNVSQHLGVMRERGVVQYRREGGHVYYWLSSPKIVSACRLMRERSDATVVSSHSAHTSRSSPTLVSCGVGPSFPAHIFTCMATHPRRDRFRRSSYTESASLCRAPRLSP